MLIVRVIILTSTAEEAFNFRRCSLSLLSPSMSNWECNHASKRQIKQLGTDFRRQIAPKRRSTAKIVWANTHLTNRMINDVKLTLEANSARFSGSSINILRPPSSVPSFQSASLCTNLLAIPLPTSSRCMLGLPIAAATLEWQVLTGDRLLLACCRCFCLSRWTLRDLSKRRKKKISTNRRWKHIKLCVPDYAAHTERKLRFNT